MTAKILIDAWLYWDSQDPTNEDWHFCVTFADGRKESGRWDAETFPRHVNVQNGGIADAVIALVYQHGGPDIESGDVVIEGLGGHWSA